MKTSILIMLCLAATSCSQRDLSKGEILKHSEPIVRANNVLALALFNYAAEERENICLSPYGISSALAVVYAGAEGKTQGEMANAMHMGLPTPNFHGAFRVLGTSIRDARGEGIQIELTNSIWFDKDRHLNEEYVRLLKLEYGIAPHRTDFSDASAAAEEINNWFRHNTKGETAGSATRHDVEQMALVVCSVIYFKGEWRTQFDRKATQPADFVTGGGPDNRVSVPMMNTMAHLRMISEESFAALELPYRRDGISMIILLPNEFDGLPVLQSELTTDNLDIWLRKLMGVQPRKTYVRIPRFSLNTSFDCEQGLARLGLASLFNAKEADLSGISSRNDLYVSQMVQEVAVSVDEEGTEAVAGTTVRVRSRSAPPSFIADHPFVFLIRENSTGNILFIGKINDPSKS